MRIWKVRDMKRDGRRVLGITCPHCAKRAIVSRSWLAVQPRENALQESHGQGTFDARVFKTRPCTYCFLTSWLPGEESRG